MPRRTRAATDPVDHGIGVRHSADRRPSESATSPSARPLTTDERSPPRPPAWPRRATGSSAGSGPTALVDTGGRPTGFAEDAWVGATRRAGRRRAVDGPSMAHDHRCIACRPAAQPASGLHRDAAVSHALRDRPTTPWGVASVGHLGPVSEKWPTSRVRAPIDRPVTSPVALHGHARTDDPLRIAYLTYRGKPHVGGQGVYTRHLTKALVDLGHHVEVLRRPALPDARRAGAAHELPSLDIFNDHYPVPLPGLLGAQDLEDCRRGRRSSRPARSPSRWPSASGPGDHLRAARRRLRPRPRQPVPRLRPPRHRAAGLPVDRHAPPPDHRRPPARDGRTPTSRRKRARRRPLVLASPRCRPGSPSGCRGSSGVARTRSRDIHADTGVDPDRHAPRARRRRPRAVPAAARRSHRVPGPADHHRLAPTSP